MSTGYQAGAAERKFAVRRSLSPFTVRRSPFAVRGAQSGRRYPMLLWLKIDRVFL
jgi:hypothetical protein